ncbi:hypothetical protein B0T10DRAFT_466391 [Thelonectria olida]|uniref:Uncharacterized protein n=1 Tax=Thelonectria olida TaxID=1576542 RepID=A0A9P9AF68_9HYPO|nr:hypothetical protein B0T10DRAFT_466391 [Thelonectria olida]
MWQDKSLRFIRKLECLRLPDHARKRIWKGFMEPGNTYQRPLFTRYRINAFEERSCVALSYTWEPSEHEEKRSGYYYVKGRNGRVRHGPGYAQSGHPVGLLGRPITTEEELVLLAQRMSCDLVSDNTGTLELSSRLPHMRAFKILKLLEAITADHWWTRAWTFPENYRGRLAIHLLIPHLPILENQKCSYPSLFGSIPGELRISSVKFHMVATRFSLAFVPTTHDKEKAKETVLRRAPKSTLLLQEMDADGCDVAPKAMSHQIIEDIEERN